MCFKRPYLASRFAVCLRPSPARLRQAATLAGDAAGILERDYGIDAGEVLSMNVDTVETSAVDASSPDFAKAVNDPANWEPYAQKTYKACFADPDGFILSKVVGSNPAVQGYYDDVTELPSDGEATTEPYYLVKMVRWNGGVSGHSDGSFKEYSVKGVVPAGTTTQELLDASGKYALNGSIYSYVTGGSFDGSREDYAGWYGTALLNNNEYEADNIDASFKLVKGGNLNEGFCFFVNKSGVTDVVHHKGKDIVVPRLSGYFMSVCCHNTRAVRTLWRFDDYVLDADSHANAYYGGIWCGAGHGTEKLWYAGNQNSYIPQPRQTVSSPTTITQTPTTVTALATWIDDAQNVDYNVKADARSIKVVRKDNGAEIDSNDRNTVNNATSYGFPNLQTTSGVTFPNKRDVEETVADIAITENANGTTSYYDSVSKKGSTVNAPNLAKGTYGFWGQNCEQGNQALITNLSVGINKVKSFGDIVYEPSWTDGALHMLINIDTKADKTMLGNDGGTDKQRITIAPRRHPLQQAATLAGDAAGILERDYGIDAGEVLSMNVDTVETVTGGIVATSPNFADVVNSWEKYAQKTYSAAFGDKNGNILERSTPKADGTYERVTALPGEGQVTTEAYVLAKYPSRTVAATIPAGKTAQQLIGEYGLSGVIFSDVGAPGSGSYTWANGTRNDNYGWWGTALLNQDEYDADNIKASFKVVQGGNLNEGFCFNVTKNENITYKPLKQDGSVYNNNLTAHPISGYFITVSAHDSGNLQRALFKAENWRLDNSFSANMTDTSGATVNGWTGGGLNAATNKGYSGNGLVWCSTGNNRNVTKKGNKVESVFGEKFECLAEWTDDGLDVDYEVECNEGRIQIWGTDNGVRTKVADVKDSTYTKGTYGFWGNNCEQKGQAQISNLNVEINKTFVKSFGDIVYEPSWTDGALHMLINIDTKADKT